jgi:hypothetical protein
MLHEGTPALLARLKLSSGRRELIILILEEALTSRKFPSSIAGSVFGKLDFALNAVAGRFGRAMMRPIKRRQYEARSNMNPQLEACLVWWCKFLRQHKPRAIPVSLKELITVVTYSDGEGTGGVGVAIWHPALRKPKAAFMRVPWLLRRLWALQSQKMFRGEDQRDIFEIEAIGPLLILDLWPDLLENALWLHFIDSAAAQAALTRGSSSVESGDAIVSLTWKRVIDRNVLPWFDRVESKANPIDGVSRGKMSGPWDEVLVADVPKGLLPVLSEELSRRGVCVD